MNSVFHSLLISLLVISSTWAMAGDNTLATASSAELIEEANELHDQGKYNEAIHLLNQVSKTDPNYAWACYELALNYYYIDHYELALNKCKEAEFIHYDHPYLYSLMGSILDETGRSEEGIVLLTNALKKWPYNQNIIYNLAVCHLNAGNPDEAEKVLQRNIVFYPYHTRSHLALAKANYAMGRIAESYLAYLMAILITPSTTNIREFEKTISGNNNLVPRSYLYPYPSGVDHTQWDNLRYLLQSELAFNKEFEFPFDIDYLFTRQAYMLISSLSVDRVDTSVYNRLYTRMFAKMLNDGYMETFINYCMKNTGNSVADKWNEKNPGKIEDFVTWAQTFLDEGRVYGYLPEFEQKEIKIHHFNDQGRLISIGEQTAKDGIRNGTYTIISEYGAVSEKGHYTNSMAEGEWMIFHPNGMIRQQLNFLHDELDGTVFTFYPDGSKQGIYPLTHGNKNGVTEEYSSSGLLIQKNSYSNNQLNGPGSYYNYPEGYMREFYHSADTLNGKAIEKWLNNKPKAEYTVKKGVIDGEYQSWYPNGNPEMECFYTNGVKTGHWVNYHYNGAIAEEGIYDQSGKLTGETRTFNNQGKLIGVEGMYKDGLLNGSYTVYFPDGNRQVTRNYVHDTLTSVEAFAGNGELVYKTTGSGDSVYFKSFYADGILMEEGLYIHGEFNGRWKKYNPLGVLVEDRTHKEGMQSGPQITYHSNGRIHEEYSCDSNRITGVYESFYKTGHLQSKSYYSKDGINGEWISYYPNDSISSRTFYRKGVVSGRSMSYDPDGKLTAEEFYNDEGIPVRTLIYDRNGEILSDWDYSYGSYTFTSYYPDGTVKSVANLSDNKRHGAQEDYYPNGQLAARLDYVHGKPHGIFKKYDHHGNPESVFHYCLGNLDGDCTWYNENLPDYATHYENGINEGKVIDYHYNGKVSREINVANNERNGFSDYYTPDGSFMYRIRYENDVMKGYTWKDSKGAFLPEKTIDLNTTGITAYYPNGQVSVRIGIKNGVYHGKLQAYYPNGNLYKESEYDNDENTGSSKEYYANGRLREVTSYIRDIQDGDYFVYYPNGKVKLSGTYCCGEKHGEWHAFDDAGNETEILYYDFGELHEIIEK